MLIRCKLLVKYRYWSMHLACVQLSTTSGPGRPSILAVHRLGSVGTSIRATSRRTRRDPFVQTMQDGSAKCAVARQWGADCMRTQWSALARNSTLAAPVHALTVAGMTIVAALLTLRAARLFIRFDMQTGLAVSSIVLVCWGFGAVRTLVVLAILASIVLLFLLNGVPTENVGHRVGVVGYDSGYIYRSPRPENTLEALRDLVKRDNQQDLPGLAYVEFDVHARKQGLRCPGGRYDAPTQLPLHSALCPKDGLTLGGARETKDGEIVVFHDDTLARAVDAAGLNAAPAAALAEAGLDVRTATIQQMTYAQLRSFHLGGHPGVHIPTLRDFLSACTELGVQRTVAVELKHIHSEAGRFSLLHQLRDYSRARSAWLTANCPENQYRPFTWAAVIAFSHVWARDFGEFGSSTWRRWGRLFLENRIPVRSCVFHSLDLVYGADS